MPKESTVLLAGEMSVELDLDTLRNPPFHLLWGMPLDPPLDRP